MTSSCVSLGISQKDYQTFADQLQSNINDLLPTVVPNEGAFLVPEGSVVQEIGSKQDLFFVLQDSLYRFFPEIYIQIEDYDLFSSYWDELSSEGALHSAFEYGDVRIEYEDSSPCVMRLRFQYNAAGQIIQKFVDGEQMQFSDGPAKELYDKTIKILNQIIEPGMTDLQKETAIHDYIIVNTKYSVSGDQDTLATASSVLLLGSGQCQGYAEALALLLILSGVDARIISGYSFDADGEFTSHAWNQVKIDDIWYHVDVTWDDPIPDMGEYTSYTYMNRSDDFMKSDHSWSDLFIVCPIDSPVGESVESTE